MFFNVCVFNAFAQSYAARPLTSTYEYHEKRKMAKCAERIREVEHSSFVPLVFSSSGGCGQMTQNCVKRLAFLLAKKRKINYADAINWMRRRIAFSLLLGKVRRYEVFHVFQRSSEYVFQMMRPQCYSSCNLRCRCTNLLGKLWTA